MFLAAVRDDANCIRFYQWPGYDAHTCYVAVPEEVAAGTASLRKVDLLDMVCQTLADWVLSVTVGLSCLPSPCNFSPFYSNVEAQTHRVLGSGVGHRTARDHVQAHLRCVRDRSRGLRTEMGAGPRDRRRGSQMLKQALRSGYCRQIRKIQFFLLHQSSCDSPPQISELDVPDFAALPLTF